MADPVTPTPDPVTPTTPAPDGDKSGDKGTADPVKMAEELGALRKTAKEYEDYRQKVDPVLETLWTDPELLDKATQSHNKRLGKAPATPPTPDPTKDNRDTAPVTPTGDPDMRTSQINMISESFENKVGIAKLDDKTKAQVRGQVGTMLKEMLDPKGNKTIPQVFEEVSLTKLPWYLEQAYKLINRDNDLKSAEEKGKNDVLQQYEGDRGSIGSIPGGSAPIDDVVLTQQEKRTAQLQGVSEEDYLKNKKLILQARDA